MRTDIPRLIVSAEGDEVPGLLEGSIELVAARAASRFTLTFATAALAADTFDDPDRQFTLTDSRSATPMLTGRADAVTVDRIGGTTVVEGRDLAALFIDQALTETYANQTASDIAIALASGHGLSATVTPTTTLAGRLFGADHALLAVATEWDLLSALATAEGFELHVTGTTLVFGPAAAAGPVALRLADCIALHQTTAPAVVRAVELTVRSWDVAGARAVTYTARRGRGRGRRQHLTRPNLTPDGAAQLANTILADLARFERTAVVTMPGESKLGIGSAVTIGADAYRVATLQRDWSRGGFVQVVHLQGAA